MDKILDKIYNMFLQKMEDLEIGHMLKYNDLCELWNLIRAYELIDSNLMSTKNINQIIEYYGK